MWSSPAVAPHAAPLAAKSALQRMLAAELAQL